jgi:hypothetical protein
MNTAILEHYKIKFRLYYSPEHKRNYVQFVSTDNNNLLSKLLEDFFLQPLPIIVIEEGTLMDSINKALEGLPFDPMEDGGGELAKIYIGAENCTVIDIYNESIQATIPTIDLKEILLGWRDWLQENDYDRYI